MLTEHVLDVWLWTLAQVSASASSHCNLETCIALALPACVGHSSTHSAMPPVVNRRSAELQPAIPSHHQRQAPRSGCTALLISGLYLDL